MIGYSLERRLLQAAVALAGIVPVGAGLAGIIQGLGAPGLFADSHYRYLSGLLLAVGALAWSSIPRIEQRGARFRLVSLIVMVGGVARLGAALSGGMDGSILFALIMELGVTPALCLWREGLERRATAAKPKP